MSWCFGFPLAVSVDLLGVAALHSRLWYALPLIVSVSLVYAATRHELMAPILDHAVRFAAWLVGFLLLFFVILFVVTNWF